MGGNAIAGWRGQGDLAWAIHSSAIRRIKRFGPLPAGLMLPVVDAPPFDDTDPDALEYCLLQYESYLLSEAPPCTGDAPLLASVGLAYTRLA